MYSAVLLVAMTTTVETPDRCFGCRGCSGCYGYSGCYGGRGCYGCSGGYGCFGGYAYGCRGGYASGCFGGYGCHGGYVTYGCHGCSGMMQYAPGGMYQPPTPGPTPGTPDKKDARSTAASATLVVNLPADAKLLVDDQPTTSTSGTRVLVSPSLPPGKEYHYTLTAEIVRDGKALTASKQVSVRAGQETRVTLEFPVADVARR